MLDDPGSDTESSLPGDRHPLNVVRSFLRTYGAWIWLSAILLLTGWFITRQDQEIDRIWALLRNADRGWLLALVLLEIGILALVCVTYRSLLRRLGHRIRLHALLGVHLQRIVVGTVTPVGGPSSVLIFIHAMRQRGVRPAEALLAVSIKSVVGNIAFLSILLPVFFFQRPSTLLVACAVALFALVLTMGGLIVVLLREAKPPQWLLNRVPRRLVRMLVQIRSHSVAPHALIGPFFYMLTTKLGGALMLFMALQAIGHDTGFGTALMAYVVGMVFLMVAPVFQGIGIVEVSMAVALQQLGVPPAAAIGATLLTRVGELWLPLAAGVLLQLVETVSQRLGTDTSPTLRAS